MGSPAAECLRPLFEPWPCPRWNAATSSKRNAPRCQAGTDTAFNGDGTPLQARCPNKCNRDDGPSCLSRPGPAIGTRSHMKSLMYQTLTGMNDFIWTLALLLGYIILSLLGRRKKQRRSTTPAKARSMEDALQDLVGFGAPVTSQPENLRVHDAPFTPNPPDAMMPARERGLPRTASAKEATRLAASDPPIRRRTLFENLRNPRSARDAFVLSEIFGAPRAMRLPIRRPGASK